MGFSDVHIRVNAAVPPDTRTPCDDDAPVMRDREPGPEYSGWDREAESSRRKQEPDLEELEPEATDRITPAVLDVLEPAQLSLECRLWLPQAREKPPAVETVSREVCPDVVAEILL